jgi:hypothetical protein
MSQYAVRNAILDPANQQSRRSRSNSYIIELYVTTPIADSLLVGYLLGFILPLTSGPWFRMVTITFTNNITVPSAQNGTRQIM